MVAELLHDIGHSLQANRKSHEGSDHPDRDEQFQYINAQVQEALAAGNPGISVDTKKKELDGDFKNGGQQWRRKGQPQEVRVHDFKLDGLGRVAPYGVYDIGANAGWIGVGTAHERIQIRAHFPYPARIGRYRLAAAGFSFAPSHSLALRPQLVDAGAWLVDHLLSAAWLQAQSAGGWLIVLVGAPLVANAANTLIRLTLRSTTNDIS